MNLFKNINLNKLKEGLNKTRERLVTRINEAVTGKAKLDEEILEELEEILITSDIGYDVSLKIIENSKIRLKSVKDRSKTGVLDVVQEELVSILDNYKESDAPDVGRFKPYVILIVGVNGAGKTTTIGKLAYNFKQSGFISNRVLMPMINEAIFALYEGVATKESIDAIMKLGMNHPMGPLALADFIGLDVCLSIMEVLYNGFNDGKYRPCPLLKKMVAANKLGKKTGEGFYKY